MINQKEEISNGVKKRVVLTGGGTGGHIVPLMTIAENIKGKLGENNVEFWFMGPDGVMERELIGKKGIPTIKISSGKMRRYFSFKNFTDIIRIKIGFFQSLWYLFRIMPDAVFSKGGYPSVPVVMAAWIYRIPVLIHESDSIPGLANRISAKFAKRIAIGFETATRYFNPKKVAFTGNPVRNDLSFGSKEKGMQRFSLSDSKPIIFIYGGSQGAWQINKIIANGLERLLHRYQVVHQIGEKTYDETMKLVHEKGIKEERRGYHPTKFLGDELKDILAAADIVVARAGATSIGEFAAAGKPVILIPHMGSASNGHQRMNAYELAEKQAAVVLENPGEAMLLEKINEIMDNPEVKNKLSENIKQFYHPDAAEKIVEGMFGMIGT